MQLTRKTRRWLWWILAGVLPVVLILIFCLAFLLPRRHNGGGTSDNDNNGDNSNGDGDGSGNGGVNWNTGPGGFSTNPASAYPSPISIQGTIPNNAIWQTLDPGLIRREADGKYFLFTTGGPNGSIWTADALRGPWSKTAGPGSSGVDGNGDSGGMMNERCGAPQLYGPLNGLYCMFHNSHLYDYHKEDGVQDPDARQHNHDASIIVQSSRTMEAGSWRRHGRLEIPWARKYNILDPALLRPGRIDRKIEFPPPSVEARADILRIHSRKMNLTRGINLTKIAEKMNGCSGAELKGVCTEAGMYALRERRVHVTQEDFELATAKILNKHDDKEVALQKFWK